MTGVAMAQDTTTSRPRPWHERPKIYPQFFCSARNLSNGVNLDIPIGNLSSPLFGHSTSIHGYGHGSACANRTIDFQLRFSF